MNNVESLGNTIIPNSEQLNADDLIAGPITVTITDVSRGRTNEQPVSIAIAGHRPYFPCKSMRRILIMAWGENGKDWVGRRMKLYCDPSVRFGGVAVGGIRISHLSDIESNMSIMLTVSRAKRKEHVVHPINFYDEKEFAKNIPKWKDAVKEGKITIDGVIERASMSAPLSADQLQAIKKIS